MKTMLRTGPIIIIVYSLCLFTLPTQAQETDAQKMLMDSIKYDKLDIAGVKAALDKGANPNWVPDTARGDSVLGRLAYAALSAKDKRAEEKGVEILQVLFRAGAKLQPRDQKILVFPICGGWALFTEVLLKNGANATREIDGETPMEMAASWGQAKIIELLRKYGVPALENRVAAQLRFISAAGRLDIPVMEEAIRNGAYVNAKNRWGKTALVNAFYMALGGFDSEDYLTILYLLEKGADPTIQGEGRFGTTTALHCAILWSSSVFDMEIKKEISKGHKDSPTYARLIIESLLRHGALVSARDGDGITPLHIAAQRNNIVGARMLIEAGAKIVPRDDKGKTPLDYAESAEMIKLLKDHGAKEE